MPFAAATDMAGAADHNTLVRTWCGEGGPRGNRLFPP